MKLFCYDALFHEKLSVQIMEGSSTFAGYIAVKLLDAVDHRPPT